MRAIKPEHQSFTTLLSFALIPLAGFATDIYLPSLPAMAGELHVTNAAIQLTLVVFMVSSGVSQLFVGSFLDSFGRWRLGTAAMILFGLASFGIAVSHNIEVIYLMRIIQGLTAAIIGIAKRAYFVDLYSGEQLKHYTSLFSIIWATAPIVAPFLGGYLQTAFGWQADFYALGIFLLLFAALELKYGGESLKHFHPFKLKAILEVYGTMLKTADFSLGLVILPLCYSMLVVFGMTSPFIIEHLFHYSPVVTGYCALFSGVALMMGGMISKALIKRPFEKKIAVAITLQLVFALVMIFTSRFRTNLFTLMPFVIALHLLAGFIFNNVYSYCLGRFSRNAGVASGVTGGALYILSSFFSYGLVNLTPIKSQGLLGGAYLTLSLLLCVVFILFRKAQAANSVLKVPKAA